MRTIFTTGQVAKICKVTPQTVAKWFDSGLLRGYRVPGGQDRRIPRKHLIRFLKEHDIPLGELENEVIGKIVLMCTDACVHSTLQRLLSSEDYKIESATSGTSGFDAGILIGSLHPDCVVIDFTIGHDEAVSIAQTLKHNTMFTDSVIIGLLSDDNVVQSYDPLLFTQTFRKPFDTALLAECIRTLIERK